MPLSGHLETQSASGATPREPRRTIRLDALGATLSGDDTEVVVHNLSATGLLIETLAGLGVGERFAIDLPHSGATEASVIWHSGDLYGCRFVDPVSAATLSAAQLRSAVVDEASEDLEPAESLGARLNRLRKEQGLSMADLANRLGVSKPTVWAWEQGRSRPVDSRIAALAEALGAEEQDLLTGRDSGAIDEVLARTREEIARAYGVRSEQVKIHIEI